MTGEILLVKAIDFTGDELKLLDQRKLPLEIAYKSVSSYRDVAEAIKSMVVRGAPAIGIAAGYGMYFSASAWLKAHGQSSDLHDLFSEMKVAAECLKRSRPTAVNLAWAVDKVIESCMSAGSVVEATDIALQQARHIEAEDLQMNRRMGLVGSRLIPDNSNILTHCNAGSLATGGYGTALGVIRAAWERGKNIHVFVDETRPLLQGSRLTSWELAQEGIPYTLITDSMAGYLMKLGKIHAVVVGADRISSNGDVANKIGTYSLAVLSHVHAIPFYVAAPYSTIDLSLLSGDDIIVEERDPSEVTCFRGTCLAPLGTKAYNPAFDITPFKYITGIITDRGMVYPPYCENLKHALTDKANCT